jgi:hypothetical protein
MKETNESPKLKREYRQQQCLLEVPKIPKRSPYQQRNKNQNV